MNKATKQIQFSTFKELVNPFRFFLRIREQIKYKRNDRITHPFWIIVQKEMTDHFRSWRFVILLVIIALTCLGSMYTALTNIGGAQISTESEGAYFFLRLFTISDGTLPSFFVFLSFLGPLLGIGLGFDAINSEQNKGTLSRILSQPIHRDFLLNAKFIAALKVISVLFFTLGYLVMGIGLIAIGIPPTVEEFMRVNFFILLSIIYVAFWLNLSILFSVRFKQPTTSALSGIAVWLFFTVFYPLIVNLIAKALEPSKFALPRTIYLYERLKFILVQIMPNELFSEATTSILMPSVRSLGPMTIEQIQGTIPSTLSLGQSILLVWPQVTGLIAATVLCFAISYFLFMRREVRSR
jgi:ABC-2 type transport system permease protein